MKIDLDHARRTTPARLAVGRAGTRPRTATWLAFQRDHAAARDAVWSEWHADFLRHLAELGFLVVHSAATDRLTYIREPQLGRQLPQSELERVRSHNRRPVMLQPVLSDGLSAAAAEAHLDRVFPPLLRHLQRLGSVGAPVAVRNGRVAVGDPIGSAVGADLVVHLIGERPGLGSADSLGCYLTFRPTALTTDADRKCVSNIRTDGLSPDEAGATIAGICDRILERQSSGTGLTL